MSKARTLANLMSDNAELADGQISVAEVVGAAPLASPDFTGTLSLAGTDLTPDFAELNHVNGVTSAIQTQMDTKSPSASPDFTGTLSLAGVDLTPTFTQLNHVAGVSSAIQTQINTKSPIAGPTFTGTATVDILNVDEASFLAIAKDISDTAVDVFVYDTSKDSDGGAWRKRTQHTSWYNEAASSTRSSRKEFPAVAVIVAESTQVTIYDGDDPDMPMWMVSNASSTNMIGENANSSVVMLNGTIAVGSAPYDLSVVSFIKDNGGQYSNSSAISGFYKGNIAERNSAKGFMVGTLPNIRGRTIKDVDITVLPNAPIDYATGLPVPTIAAATTSGVSVILDNGTVVDIPNDGSTGGPITVSFYGGNKIMTGCNTVGNGIRMSFSYFIPTSDTNASSTAFRVGKYVDSTTSGGDLFYSNVPSNIAKSIAYGDNNIASHADAVGLLRISEDEANPSLGMTNFVTPTYNTGWMNGAIKLATLSDTSTTSVTGGTQPDRSANNNALNVSGTITKTAVTSGADLVGYGGWSTSNKIQQPHNSGLNFGTGDFSVITWFKSPAQSTAGYLFDRSDSAGHSRIAIYLNSDGTFTTYTTNSSGGAASQANSSWYIGVWHQVMMVRKGGVICTYLDGRKMAAGFAQTTDLSNDNAPLCIGTRYNSVNAFTGGSLALMRWSATAPSEEQITKIYNDEKHLFKTGAQATLYGTSIGVTALAHDDTTDLLHVGTSAGRSVFQGLRRVENTTNAVGATISASNGLVAED